MEDNVDNVDSVDSKGDDDCIVLKEEEKLNLIHLIKTSNSDKVIKDSKEALIDAHRKLISSIVKRHGFMDDYNVSFQTGVFGVLKAIDKFDINKVKNCKVASFFGIWIFKELRIEKALKGIPVTISHTTADQRYKDGKGVGRVSMDDAEYENINRFALDPDVFFDFGIDDDMRKKYEVLYSVIKELNEEELEALKSYMEKPRLEHKEKIKLTKEELTRHRKLYSQRYAVVAKIRRLVLLRCPINTAKVLRVKEKARINNDNRNNNKQQRQQNKEYYQRNKEVIKARSRVYSNKKRSERLKEIKGEVI